MLVLLQSSEAPSVSAFGSESMKENAVGSVEIAHHHYPEAPVAGKHAPTCRGKSMVRLVVSPMAFRGFWCAMFLIHVALGAFAISAAMVHHFIADNDTFASLRISQPTLEASAVGFLLVAGGHVVTLVSMVYQSIRARQLTFNRIPRDGVVIDSAPSPSPNQTSHRDTRRSRVRALVALLRIKAFRANESLGIHGDHFETIFLIKEGIELLLQTYQAYCLSRAVPSPLVNRIAVTAIVLNCASVIIVHYFYRRDDGVRRVVNLVSDTFLDCCCSVVVPLIIVLPYALVFNAATNLYPDEKLMDDIWFVTAVSESRQLLVTSFVDFISTMVPHIGLQLSLRTLRAVVQCRSQQVKPLGTPLASERPESDVTSEEPHAPQGEPMDLHAHPKSSHPRRTEVRRRRIVHSLFLIWGVIVLGFHLEAGHRAAEPVNGCRLHTTAWASAGYSCSFLVANCHLLGVDGESEQLDEVLDQLDRSSLQVLVFAHCPRLSVPPILSEFFTLLGLEVFNSTIVSWPEAAAIHQDLHPEIGYLSPGAG